MSDLTMQFQTLWDNLILEFIDKSYSEIYFVNSHKVKNIYFKKNPDVVFQEDNQFLKNNMEQFFDFILNKINMNLPPVYSYHSHGETEYSNLHFQYEYNTLVQGFNFILKVAETKAIVPPLNFTEPQYDHILNAIYNKSNIIVAGVTGSGKTTTAKKIVEEVAIIYPDLNIISMEVSDKSVHDIIHSNVDLIYFGEIRDLKSYNNFKLLVENNIAVVATIHANSALEVFDRLYQIGKNNLQKYIGLIIFQTLIARVCHSCSVAFNSVDDVINQCENAQEFYHYRNMDILSLKLKKAFPNTDLSNVCFEDSKGCDDCGQRGTKSLVTCNEVITIDPRMHDLLEEGQDVSTYLKFLADDNPLSDNMIGKGIQDHAIYHMLTGLVGPETLIKKFNLLG